MSGELNIDIGITGLTVTANVYLLGVAKATGISCPEIGSTGKYSGDFSASPNVAGVYQVAFFHSGSGLSRGGGQVVWDGSAEVHQTGDGYTQGALIKAKTDNLPSSPAAVGSAMTLTTGERTAIANEVEAQIIDDTDSEKVLTAITDKIASVNPSLSGLTIAAIASGVRTELGTELGRIDVAVSTRFAAVDYTAPLSASGTRTALGLASANLDTQLAGITAPSAATIADAVWDEVLSGHATAGSTGSALAAGNSLGAGAISWTYTLTRSDTSAPIADAAVWVTSDEAGTNVIASGRTNASGQITFMLDAGDIYVWRAKSGWNFTNPDQETVTP